jgi:hypothetical protein
MLPGIENLPGPGQDRDWNTGTEFQKSRIILGNWDQESRATLFLYSLIPIFLLPILLIFIFALTKNTFDCLLPHSNSAAAARIIQHENTVVERLPSNSFGQSQQGAGGIGNKSGQHQSPLAPVSNSSSPSPQFPATTASAASSPAPPLPARASPILSGEPIFRFASLIAFFFFNFLEGEH